MAVVGRQFYGEFNARIGLEVEDPQNSNGKRLLDLGDFIHRK